MAFTRKSSSRALIAAFGKSPLLEIRYRSFVSRLGDFLSIVSIDSRRYVTKLSLKSLMIAYLSSPGFRLVLLIRLSAIIYHHRYWPLLNYVIQKKMLKYGADIAPSAKFGPGLKIVHTSGIVIGGGVNIGKNATILHGVTCGERRAINNLDPVLYPSVGDNVIIGNSSSILGGIIVGNNVRISRHSLILKDVPNNTHVYGTFK